VKENNGFGLLYVLLIGLDAGEKL